MSDMWVKESAPMVVDCREFSAASGWGLGWLISAEEERPAGLSLCARQRCQGGQGLWTR
jgi:hypothetical protein